MIAGFQSVNNDGPANDIALRIVLSINIALWNSRGKMYICYKTYWKYIEQKNICGWSYHCYEWRHEQEQ